jgi:menaquinone-dependent protoporphyrinogen IX oxidase
VNSLFGMHTAIEPEHPDLAAYGRIIVAGPIWAGKLAAATRTFLALNRLDGKKVALFATTNVPENESSRNKNIALAAKAGGAVLGYWQVAVTEKVDGKKVEIGADRIRQEALALAPDIRAAFEK